MFPPLPIPPAGTVAPPPLPPVAEIKLPNLVSPPFPPLDETPAATALPPVPIVTDIVSLSEILNNPSENPPAQPPDAPTLTGAFWPPPPLPKLSPALFSSL